LEFKKFNTFGKFKRIGNFAFYTGDKSIESYNYCWYCYCHYYHWSLSAFV